MDRKSIAKRYLISAFLLYFCGAAVLTGFVYALARVSGSYSLDAVQSLGVALLCSLVPLGSYTGFVVCGLKLKEIKTGHAALLVVFFPAILVFVTVFGVIMIIPSVIKSIVELIRG